MHSLNAIISIAKYESRILSRSWFFKIFAILTLLMLFAININTLSDAGNNEWSFRAIPSSIPYLNFLFLNITQSIIAIFLSSEFIRRDKKLDTSVVFYVRPPSNAEYVIGKTLGNLQVFLGLILASTIMALIFNWLAQDSYVNWMSYLQYFLLLSLPTLLFVMGFSFVFMLLLNSQALTFVIMLGYTGMVLFYIKGKFFGVLDFIAMQYPMFKSEITGFANVREILLHRGAYMLLGIGAIAMTIALFKRLPHSPSEKPKWMVIGSIFIAAGLWCGYTFIQDAQYKTAYRNTLIEVNNKYAYDPLLQITDMDLKIEQLPDAINAEVSLSGIASRTADNFVFTLNPDLNVTSVSSPDYNIDFIRDYQILKITLNKPVRTGDILKLNINYQGGITEGIAYLDQPNTVLNDKKTVNMMMVNHNKRYAFLESGYVLLTPELYWYPRAGTAYSESNPNWNYVSFTKYNLEVKTLPGLTPVSQGNRDTLDAERIRFYDTRPMPGLTLAVGEYEKQSMQVDSIEFNLFLLKGHNYFSGILNEVQDTLPIIIGERLGDLSRNLKLEYGYPRFSIVEVPAHHTFYPRNWTIAQETMQPEIILFPEKGFSFWQADIKRALFRTERDAKNRGESMTAKEYQLRVFRNFMEIFTFETNRNFNFSRNQGRMISSSNPYYIYPQFYSFKYNLSSTEWPIANYLLESYLLRGSSFSPQDFVRNRNGISDEERINVLLQKESMAQILADTSRRSLTSVLVGLKSEQLFAHAEREAGVDSVKRHIYSILDENKFQNLPFNRFLSDLYYKTGANLMPVLEPWYNSTDVPSYFIGTPEIVRIAGMEDDIYELTMKLENPTSIDGLVKVNISFGGGFGGGRGGGMFGNESESRVIYAGAHESLEVVYHFLSAPRNVTFNTLVSQNLPSTVTSWLGRPEQVYRTIRNEAEYLMTQSLNDVVPGEIIVDNEDPGFSMSKPEVSGLLQKWLLKEDPLDDGIKFKGYVPWRPPYYWAAITNSGCYGLFIRSSYIVRSGNGNQVATWKAVIPEEGRYDLFYHVFRDESLRQNRGRGGPGGGGGGGFQYGEYHFVVDYDNIKEDAFLDIQKSEDGWNQLGTYDIKSDTVTVTLGNKTSLRTVNADAIKFVKRQL